MTTFHERIYQQMMDAQRMQSKMLFVPSFRKTGRTYVQKFIHSNPYMKPTFKWQFWCKPFGRDYYRVGGGYGWRIFELGCIKIIQMPEPGEQIHKKLYKGFIIRFAYWLPVDRAY